MRKIIKSYSLKLNKYFFKQFKSNELTYVLYPFLRIFKLLGFLPVQLEPAEFLNENYKFKLDKSPLLATFIGTIFFIVGFYCGVVQLSKTRNLMQVYESSKISYFTTWGQIAFLFGLGSYGLLNTWCNIYKMQRLFSWISQIDRQLEEISGRKIDYKQMRKQLFLQLFVVFMVSSCLSIMNCIVIHYGPSKINVFSSCFWFLCFVPILLLTLEAYQFYSLIFVLKTKFDMINKELQRYAGGDSLLGFTKVETYEVINAIKPECSTDIIKKLMKIYTNTADCVDLLLKVFEWHLVLLTCLSFGVITTQGYNLFAALILHSMEMGGYQLTVVMCWILVQILIIGLNVGACGMTSKAMYITGPLLHRIKTNSQKNCNLYLSVQQFSYEILHSKNGFTIDGFFVMNYKQFTSIFAAVITYLIFILQFHFKLHGGMTEISLQQG